MKNLKQYLFVSALLLIADSPAMALTGFTRLANCGGAKLISGDTCATAKVELDFSGCENKSAPQPAMKILCENTRMRARFQDENYRYEAQFFKGGDDNWGATSTWSPAGPLRQYRKIQSSAAAPAAPVAPSATPAPVSAAPAPAPAAPAAEATPAVSAPSLKFSGFVDLRYSNFASKNNMSAPNAHAESGFGLEDGALYLNYDNNKVSAIIDIAFRRGKDIDTNPSAIPNQSSNNNFGIGVDKSQAYIKYKALDSLAINFGQFDTIYGVELNDSKDRIFSKTGIVYDGTLPVTHTGLMLEYYTHGFYSKLFAANPNNKGTYGTSAAGDENSEYGLALGYSNENFRTQLGAMGRPILKADGTDTANRLLIDVTAGMTFGIFSMDFEYAHVDDPNKNSLTPADNTDHEKVGSGLMLLTAFQITDSFLLGLRYEHLQDDPLALGTKTVDSYGLAANYKLNSDLKIKAEYIGYNLKNIADVTWDDTRFNAAAVLTF